MTIGERIKQKRLECGLTQGELAFKIGYQGKSAINKIEKNLRDIAQDKIVACANALNTTPEYLMGWTAEIESADLITIWNKLNNSGKELLLEYANDLAAKDKYTNDNK